MNKIKIFVVLLSVFSILLGSTALVNAAPPEGKPEGNPFEELREDIAFIQEEVFKKEKSGIWKAIYDLRDKVGILENQLADLTNRITDLENWKNIIDAWRTEIDSWKIFVQNEIADLRVAIEPSELLSKIKLVDGSNSGLDADLLDGLDSNNFAITNGIYPDLNVGYADSAGNADTVDGKNADELGGLWIDDDGYIYPNNVGNGFQITDTGNLYIPGDVGIGTTNPTHKLEVAGNIKGQNLCIGNDCRSAWPTSTATDGDVYTGVVGIDNSIILSKESIITLDASTYYGGGHCASIEGYLYIDGIEKRHTGQSGCYHNSDTLSMSYTIKLLAGNYNFRYTRTVNDASVYSDYFVIVIQSKGGEEETPENELEIPLPE
ncbi:MAG: hypothetical protein ABIC36_02380 [bacterium]